MCWHRFNHQFHAPIPPNCSGFFPNCVDACNTNPCGMLNYGSNFLGYGAITYGHGPFNNWAHPPTQQTPPTLQFSQPSTIVTPMLHLLVVPLAGFSILELLFKSLPEYCLVKSQETSELLLRGSVGPDCLYTFSSVSLHSIEQFQSCLSTLFLNY